MNAIQQYINASRKRKIKLGDQDVDVLLATQEQLDRFTEEAASGENNIRGQVDLARRWLPVLVPDWAQLEDKDVPPVLIAEIFYQQVVPAAFAPKKNG